MVEVETILASLYANGFNVSLEWRSHGGFRTRLGEWAQAEHWFRRSGEAVRWLKEQALLHFPEAEFAPERDQTEVAAEVVLDDLYRSHISGSLE
jgi:hypothetical protein